MLDHGIRSEVLANPVGSAKGRFDGNRFDIDPAGVSCLTFLAEDRGEATDIIAWSPDTGQIGSWFGTAFALGDLAQIWNPATYFGGDALAIHADPLAWLKYRQGLCITNPKLAWSYLHTAPRIIAVDEAMAGQLAEWLKPPMLPTPKIFIRE
jgi:hypothetical protein